MDIAKIIREFQAIFGITATERKWLTDQITAALPPAQEWHDISTAVTAERERCAAIVDAEAVFARENLDAIPDEAEADLGSRLTPRYYWNQRRALAEYYAKFIRSGAPMVAEDGTLIADHRTKQEK